MNFEQLKEKSVEIMLKEIKKEAIYMVEAIERDYEPSQIMEAVVYAMDNKEVIESFSKKPKTLIELYDLYVIQGHIFKPLAPLTGISLDKEKVDFNELKSMILEADESNIIEVFETTKDWLTKFKTITLNWIDIRDIIDETNITFTYNSLDKVTKEAARENLMQNLQYLLQYAQRDLNMSEIIKVLAGQDFDPWKILKPQTQVEEEQQLLPEWQWEVQWTKPVEEEWDILSQLQNIV